MRKFRSRDISSNEGVLDALEAVMVVFRETGVERVAVVEFGMNKNKSSGDGTGSFVVQRGADTA